MAGVDELDLLALGEGREHGDIRVAAEPEDVSDPAVLQIAHQLMGDEVGGHGDSPVVVYSAAGESVWEVGEIGAATVSAAARSGTGRSATPV